MKLEPGQLWLIRVRHPGNDECLKLLAWLMIVLDVDDEDRPECYNVITFVVNSAQYAGMFAGIVQKSVRGLTFSMENIVEPAQQMHTYELISDA